MEMHGECGIKRIHGKARCNDWGKMNNILWSRPVSRCPAVTSHRTRNVFASTVTREKFANNPDCIRFREGGRNKYFAEYIAFSYLTRWDQFNGVIMELSLTCENEWLPYSY